MNMLPSDSYFRDIYIDRSGDPTGSFRDIFSVLLQHSDALLYIP